MSIPETPEQWSELWEQCLAANASQTGFMQTTWWTELMVRNGMRLVDAFYLDDGRIVGGAKVLINQFAPEVAHFYIPDGPILSDDPETARREFEGLIDYLDRYRALNPTLCFSHLRIERRWSGRPHFVDHLRIADDWLEPRSTIYIDLRGSPEELLARMRPTGRRWVRKAAANGVRIVEDGSDGALEEFQRLYYATMARKGQNSVDPDILLDLARTLFANACGALYFAEHEGRRVAAALVVFFGQTATYLFAASDGDSRRTMAPYLLNYRIMCDAAARGLRWYDLYGGAPATQPNHPLAAISIFKHNLGGIDVDHGPALDHVFDEEGYALYQQRLRERHRVPAHALAAEVDAVTY